MWPYVLVMYKFDGVPEHTVLVRPHGNAKESKPYRRTMKSTRHQLEKELQVRKPKDAVDVVFESKGGMVHASSAGHKPTTSNANCHNKSWREALVKKFLLYSLSGTRDMLYLIMEQCKSMERERRFVQDVTRAPEPMAILCFEQQLLDMERFCCDPYQFSVFGVDPTFCLGDFSVTPSVYRHLLEDTKTSQ